MKEIISVISRAFNHGYHLGKITCERKVTNHELKASLKEEIEYANKWLRPHNKTVEAEFKISQFCQCKNPQNDFYGKSCVKCGKSFKSA